MVNSTQKNPDDIVITFATRTPLAKGKKGGLKDTPLDGIVFKILEKTLQKSRIDPQLVEDVCLGNVRTHGHAELIEQVAYVLAQAACWLRYADPDGGLKGDWMTEPLQARNDGEGVCLPRRTVGRVLLWAALWFVTLGYLCSASCWDLP